MSEQLKPSVTAALAMQILAELAQRTPLRFLSGLCEQQKQISTAKLAEYVEQAGDQLADYAFKLRQHNDALHAEAESLRAENERLRSLINTPHTDEWIDAVRLEAAHQIERWGTGDGSGKTPADWFWLLGYLGQKAMVAQMAGDDEKAKHHTISSGAMLLNWFRAVVGDTNAMRPGIEVKQ